MKKFAGFIALVLIGSFALAGCSGGGGGGGAYIPPDGPGKIQLSGTVDGGGYNYKPAPTIFSRALSILGLNSLAYAGITIPAVDQIVALPMERGSLSAWGMRNAKRSTIGDDGTFSLSITKDMDWLLVLIDSSATGTNRFVGSIAMNTATGDGLLNLPATDADISSMNLGTLTRTLSDDAISSATVTATDFNMTADQLTAMAKTDDLFRNAMNIVNNYGSFGNPSNVWYTLRPDFSWTGVLSQLTTTFSDPDMLFKGMSFQLDTNSPSVTMDEICSAGTTTLKLIPPGPITDQYNGTYNKDNPITNADVVCSNLNGDLEANGTNFYATDAYEGMSYSFPADFTSLPPGEWVWEEDEVTKAVFDVNTVNPPLTEVLGPKGFVPSFRVHLVPGAGQQIASVEVKWYYYDGSYVPLDDRSVLKHFISQMEVKFDVTYNNSRKTCEMYFDPVTTTQVSPSNPAFGCPDAWYYNDDIHPETNTGLMGFYESGGFGYFFHFFPIAQ